MAKKYFINNMEVEAPINWADFEMTISQDREARILLEEFDEGLRFRGLGFNILRDLICNGICSTATFMVWDDCVGEEYSGLIILAESKFSDCEVEAKVRNESLFFKLDANKDAEHYLGTAKSPNGTLIDTYPPETFFNDDTGEEITMYHLVSAIKHTVAFVSDNSLEFKSSFLESNFSDLYITNGSRLRSGAQLGIELTLQKVVDEIFMFFNLWTDIREINGKLTYIVEPYEYFFKNENLTGECLKVTSFSANEELLFGNISIKSDFDKTPNFPNSYPININSRYLGFKADQSNAWGDLNIARGTDCANTSTLSFDLDWIRDHNIIQDVIINKKEEYDNDIFLIDKASENEYPKPYTATEYYNERLTNVELLKYWKDYLSGLGFPTELLAPIYESWIDTLAGNYNLVQSTGGDSTADGNPFIRGAFIGWEESDPSNPYNGVGGQKTAFDGVISGITHEKNFRIPYLNYGVQQEFEDNYNRRSFITPECDGYYNIQLTLVGYHGFYEFGNVGLARDAFGSIHWTVLEVTGATTSSEIARTEVFNGQVGFNSGFRFLQIDKVMTKRVYLEAGKQYMIDELEVNLVSHEPYGNPVTYGYNKKVGTSISVYLDEENDCITQSTSGSKRGVIAEVEGPMNIEDWQRFRKNKGLRFCAQGCSVRILGWVDELTFNSADCWVSGNILGSLECFSQTREFRESAYYIDSDIIGEID